MKVCQCALLGAIIFVVLMGFPSGSCGATADFGVLRRPSRDLILGFDLQNDIKPSAVALLIAGPVVAPKMEGFVVPSRLTSVTAPEELFVTWGAFRTSSLLTYIVTPSNAGSYAISFVPGIVEPQEDFLDVSKLHSGVYLVRAGLERYFVVDSAQTSAEVEAMAAVAGRRDVDGIAVALPRGSVGIEIQGGMTSIPRAAESHEQIRLFVADGGIAPARVEVRYKLPPTEPQKLILKWGLKFVSVLFLPLLSLILLQGPDLKRPKVRKISIFVIGIIQLTVLVAFIVIVFQIPEAAADDPVIDFVIAIGGGLAQASILLTKSGKAEGKAPDPPRS